jgi:signal transduction histidine kinase
MIRKEIAVLLVEDNYNDALLIERYLSQAQRFPHQVIHVDRLGKGLECLAGGGVDVVLLDLDLPDGRGLGTFEKVHEFAPSVPIIVLTGHDEDDIGIESVQKGAQDYLFKGEVAGNLLRHSIRYAIERMKLIADLKRAEEERLKKNVIESIGILAGGMAHDFNNLLAAIMGNINIAKASARPVDNAFARLTEAEQVCNMAAQLVKRLMTFATGGDPVKRVVSMSDLFRGEVSSQLIGSNITPLFALPHDLHPAAVDEAQIKQVIGNLVLNAREAMPEGGTLTLRGENLRLPAQNSVSLPEGNYVKISLRDTGPGISPEKLSKIFNPYYSTKDTYSQKGLGLGLAVCYSVIKRHDGLIALEPEAGKGTTFHLYLPAAVRK